MDASLLGRKEPGRPADRLRLYHEGEIQDVGTGAYRQDSK